VGQRVEERQGGGRVQGCVCASRVDGRVRAWRLGGVEEMKWLIGGWG
jgi:hypothetical protein